MNRNRGSWVRILCGVAACLSFLVLPSLASANLQFEHVGVNLTEPNGTHSRQAGAHPDFSFTFSFPPGPPEAVRDVNLDLPVGMVGNPSSFPECPMDKLFNSGQAGPACDVQSQVGKVRIVTAGGPSEVALFNLTHGPDVPARFGFHYIIAVGTITPQVRAGDYGISAGSFEISQIEPLKEIEVTFWGSPADPSHDFERQKHAPFLETWEKVVDPAPLDPFWINPTACPSEAQSFRALGDSYEHPGIFDVRSIPTDESGTPFVWEGCENLPFEPTMTPVPGTHRAHSPTGLDVTLELPPNESPKGYIPSALKEAVIDFPPGLTVSPSAVAGLEACSEAQVKLGSNDPPTCPDGSKIGNITLNTQLIKDPLPGEVVLATQNANPFHSTYALYLIVKGLGFYLKLPGELNVDKQNGHLRAVFPDLPQLPFESFHLDFRGGPTAPLVTPDRCGNYSIRTELFPWAQPDKPVVATVPMPIDEGCAGGGDFKPALQAGVENPTAGARSPLVVRIRRQDGEQNLSTIEVTLPKGELASLRGLDVCEGAAAAAGSCPAGSQVGIATTAIGTGAFPLFVPQPGKDPTALYLGGPYKGAPYSLITKVPAQSGPFDFGTIVVRTAIDLNPVTAQIIAKSDPLPQILEGVPIQYRDVRIEVKKPDFTVNPTSCEQRFVTTTITSVNGTQAHPSVPTKVGDCGALNFKPKLGFRLKGGTHRGDFPALTATLTTGKKEANLSRVQATLPHSEFLEQGHIGTVCTRVQFAADQCPPASIYGHATAFTPLLDKPLSGPVYLRSSNHPLPDLVADLQGQFDIELAGRIDSKNGGIRTTFETVPDAPVTKFVLAMAGGKKSLLVNSRNLCKAPSRATIRMVGQNGMVHDERPLMQNRCGGKKAGKEKKGARR